MGRGPAALLAGEPPQHFIGACPDCGSQLAFAEQLRQVLAAAVALHEEAAAMGERLARERGIENGYRTVLNVGPGAGQSVFHLHVHLLGGRDLKWPPG